MTALVEDDRAPIYIVNFTQRDCAELAQNLTSLPLDPEGEPCGDLAGAR